MSVVALDVVCLDTLPRVSVTVRSSSLMVPKPCKAQAQDPGEREGYGFGLGLGVWARV